MSLFSRRTATLAFLIGASVLLPAARAGEDKPGAPGHEPPVFGPKKPGDGPPHRGLDSPGPPREGGPRRPPISEEREAEIRELVSSVLMARVSRELELTDEQTVVMIRQMQEMREKMGGLWRQREAAGDELREALKNDAPDADLEQKLDAMIRVDQERNQLRWDYFKQMAAGLSVKQRAKLYVFLQEFEWHMRRLIQRAIEMSKDPEGMKRLLEEAGLDRNEGRPKSGSPDKPQPEAKP
ncbi:MAG: hypothetical protein AMXMBFR4_00880 [Candidatus Hydrogenedentota bacterium]